MQPIKTIQLRLTPAQDSMPAKVYVLRPRGTLYWEGRALMATTFLRLPRHSKWQGSHRFGWG